jgi:hypothetical protein
VPEKRLRTMAGPALYDVALVVLVNGETAGTPEVLAAALQEHDRALIAGEPTLGKGAVESVIALSGGTGLRLTTAQYFTPQGRLIQRPLPGTALGAPGSAPNAHPNPGWPSTRRKHSPASPQNISPRIPRWTAPSNPASKSSLSFEIA